jgi:uncharacterized membrane protein
MRTAEQHKAAFFAESKDSIETKSSRALEISQFINIFLAALVTGVFWGPWLGLSRSMSQLSPETFLEVGHTMIRNLGMVMAILMPAGMLATLGVLYLTYRRHSKAFYLTLAGFLLSVVALSITLIVEVPIDNLIEQWTVNSLPENWRELRDRWEFFHAIRTWISVVGIGLFLAGALFGRSENLPLKSDAPVE